MVIGKYTGDVIMNRMDPQLVDPIYKAVYSTADELITLVIKDVFDPVENLVCIQIHDLRKEIYEDW